MEINMAIVLYIRNRNAQLIKKLGLINTDDFEKITEIASSFNLHCLPLFDYMGDTILNHKQIIEFIKEINFLRNQNTEIKEEYLDILNTAAQEALEESDYYLLINGE